MLDEIYIDIEKEKKDFEKAKEDILGIFFVFGGLMLITLIVEFIIYLNNMRLMTAY